MCSNLVSKMIRQFLVLLFFLAYFETINSESTQSTPVSVPSSTELSITPPSSSASSPITPSSTEPTLTPPSSSSPPTPPSSTEPTLTPPSSSSPPTPPSSTAPTLTPPSSTASSPSTPTSTTKSTSISSTSKSSSTSSTSKSTSTTPTTTTLSTTPTTPPPVVIIGQRSFTWNSDEMDHNEIIFNVTEGHFVSVTVSDVKFSDGNYLRIASGTSYVEGTKDLRVFANTVKGPISYLFKTTSVNAFCENGNPDINNTIYDFVVEFKEAGEVTTTTSTTSTTTISVPPTEKDDSIYITVNVTGRSLSEYSQAKVREDFQTCIATIANNYCKEQNINLLQTITERYVMISEIKQCPYNWPDSEKCVQITFKLPIFHDESKWDGYQLNSEHLGVMWLRKDELDTGGCLKNNAFEDYDDPDFDRAIVWWAVGISLVIVAFVILLWFLRTIRSKTIKNKRGEDDRSDTHSILSKRTNSVSSMTPHYLQDHLDTPKFFDC